MRAAVLATVVVALVAGVDARAHKKRGACKPKHSTLPAVSAGPSSAGPEVIVPATTLVPGSSAPASSAATTTDVLPSEIASSAAPVETSVAPVETSVAPVEPTTEPAPESTAAPTTAEAPVAEATTSVAPDTPQAEGDAGADIFPAENSPGATGPASMQKRILDMHNEVRAQYGAAPLEWDQSLADFAAGHSDQCTMEHTTNEAREGKGENLSANTQASLAGLFKGWAAEDQFYNWANPGPEPNPPTDARGRPNQLGHWTQIVWKDTKKLGCAWKTCSDGTIFTGYGPSVYLVCEYFPGGNMGGWDAASTTKFYTDNISPKV